MSSEDKITGGCMCGSIRYEASAQPFWSGYCHCRTCQRATGGPFGLFVDFRRDELKFSKGKPKIYHSTPWGERGFCANCGSPISMGYRGEHMSKERLECIGIYVGSLDEPEIAHPTEHQAVETQLPWLVVDDGLPRSRLKDDLQVQEAMATFAAAREGKEDPQ